MTERVGKRESSFDGCLFEIEPAKTQGPSPRAPLSDKEAIERSIRRQGGGAYVDGPRAGTDKQKIEQALRDQGAGSYVDGPRLPTGERVLADLFSRRAKAPALRAAVTLRSGNIAKQDAIGRELTKLQAKYDRLTGRLESSIKAWEGAKKTIANREKDPTARQQKLAYANDAIGRIRTQLREARIEFGVVEHEYKVALGHETRAAIGPAKPGDRMLSEIELAGLKNRSATFAKRIDTLSESGLIAPVAAFLYVVLTEASGRLLDEQDYRALDLMYAVGKLGEAAIAVPGEAMEVQHKYAPDQHQLERGIQFDGRIPAESRPR